MFAVALSEPNSFAGSLAKEIQFCPSRFAASNRLYVNNIRRMEREYSLYTLVIDNSAYREGLVDSAAFAGNYYACKDLNPFFVAFLDSAVHIDRIAYFEMRYVLLEVLTLYSVKQFCFHRLSPIGSLFYIL